MFLFLQVIDLEQELKGALKAAGKPPVVAQETAVLKEPSPTKRPQDIGHLPDDLSELSSESELSSAENSPGKLLSYAITGIYYIKLPCACVLSNQNFELDI